MGSVNYKFSTYILLVGLIAVSSVFYYDHTARPTNQSEEEMATKLERYDLINKTKVYNLEKHYIIDFSDLKKNFLDIQSKYPLKTYIYFNYINNGSWIGLGEKDEITAASLVKVPIAMSIYKAAEQGRIDLKTQYTIEELDLNADFGTLYKSGAGNKYTVEDLIKIMLEQSDNTARAAVFNVLTRIGIENPLDDVYNNLGWDIKPPTMVSDAPADFNYSKISLKVLANMFLSLYNSTYVNLDHSQKILAYLSQTDFNDKIKAGVPGSIIVSHKIGASYNDRILSDCGVVYAPNRNYVLCVATEGGDSEAVASQFMAEISKAAYSFVITN